ncbi:MAG: GIY-YIG nuclease family protein [Clostridia bacterium]|nr:GIY-YIG nuclease family protein [Clostridia bacterium]
MSVYKKGRPHKYNPTTKEGIEPPSKQGEYRIRNADGKIMYIGETNNLKRRMNEHIRSGKLPCGEGENSTFEYQVADGRSSSVTRREHERQKIEKHAPLLNRSGGGEGRIAIKKRKSVL